VFTRYLQFFMIEQGLQKSRNCMHWKNI